MTLLLILLRHKPPKLKIPQLSGILKTAAKITQTLLLLL